MCKRWRFCSLHQLAPIVKQPFRYSTNSEKNRQNLSNYQNPFENTSQTWILPSLSLSWERPLPSYIWRSFPLPVSASTTVWHLPRNFTNLFELTFSKVKAFAPKQFNQCSTTSRIVWRSPLPLSRRIHKSLFVSNKQPFNPKNFKINTKFWRKTNSGEKCSI